MTTFTYVTVSYCYVGVTYRYVDGGYLTVGYGGVWRLEMWRRTHPQGLTRGVAVDRMEVQQGEREKGTPMDIEIDFFEELGGYYTADLADILADFEG